MAVYLRLQKLVLPSSQGRGGRMGRALPVIVVVAPGATHYRRLSQKIAAPPQGSSGPNLQKRLGSPPGPHVESR